MSSSPKRKEKKKTELGQEQGARAPAWTSTWRWFVSGMKTRSGCGLFLSRRLAARTTVAAAVAGGGARRWGQYAAAAVVRRQTAAAVVDGSEPLGSWMNITWVLAE